jgi:hypothetical protein
MAYTEYHSRLGLNVLDHLHTVVDSRSHGLLAQDMVAELCACRHYLRMKVVLISVYVDPLGGTHQDADHDCVCYFTSSEHILPI